MPIFEYRCQECGQVFEVFVHRVNPTAVPACPRCGNATVERLWSTFAAPTGSRAGCRPTADGIG